MRYLIGVNFVAFTSTCCVLEVHANCLEVLGEDFI